MNIYLGLLTIFLQCRRAMSVLHEMETKVHYPYGYRPLPSQYVNGTSFTVPEPYKTPDFRYPEPPFVAYAADFYQEEERPYRLSPFYKQQKRYSAVRQWFTTGHKDRPYNLGCYCTTVYKRLTLLAGCAVITTRHILTTATSTELVLKDHRDDFTLENILGAWYDHDSNTYNSSLYMTPARIHYHPRYMRPHQVNASHPLPVVYDIAVWAATYPFYGRWYTFSGAVICLRGSSGWFEYSSSIPRFYELALIVGYQFMLAWKRTPLPWMKYVIRTRKHRPFCPKTDWGWYHCIQAYWAKFGIESGAAWHRALEGKGWRYDGLIGLSAITMKLRSVDIVGYFTVLDTHPVLDFLYSAYMGWQKCEYLDGRFWNSSGRAPVPKPWFSIKWDYTFGVETLRNFELPFYRK